MQSRRWTARWGGRCGRADAVAWGPLLLLSTAGSCHPSPPRSPPPSPARPPLQGVLKALHARGIEVRVATKHLAAEEAPESYKARGGCSWAGGLGSPLWSPAAASSAPLHRGHPPSAASLCTHTLQDVDAVVRTCDAAGICRKVVRLRPIAVVKG